MEDLILFVNSTYKVLDFLYDKKDCNNLVRITQNEIALAMGLSRVTINTSFKELKEKKYIVHDESRIGCYYLTDKAIKLVKTLKEIGE